MSVADRLARLGDRVFDRLRHRSAFALDESAAVDGDLRSLRGGKYAVLVTFRRDGTAVPSPVWFAVDDEARLYLHTAAEVGKVKRVRHDPRVLVAPATMRGRPTGPALRGSARLLPPEEWPRAEAALAAAYGLARRLAERSMAAGDDPGAYIEVVARSSPGGERRAT